jgi:hypothetical protein
LTYWNLRKYRLKQRVAAREEIQLKMTQIVKELRDALVEAGTSRETANAAAAAVVARDWPSDSPLTKGDFIRGLCVQTIAIFAAMLLIRLL